MMISSPKAWHVPAIVLFGPLAMSMTSIALSKIVESVEHIIPPLPEPAAISSARPVRKEASTTSHFP